MRTATNAEGRRFVLLDTSAAIALMVEDHDAHAATLDAIRGRQLGLAGHAWFETYSVLTRLPAGLRRSPGDALRLLAGNFPASRFLGEAEAADLGRELAVLRISGGAVYDALGLDIELIPQARTGIGPCKPRSGGWTCRCRSHG